MKTEVMMIRELGDIKVRQSNQTEMFNVTDLVNGYNEVRRSMGLPEKRLDNYWRADSTQEFLEALEHELSLNTSKSRELELSLNGCNSTELKITRKGKFGGTYVAPEVFVDIAMWLNPSFKAKVMIWVSDNLLGVRNTTGIQQQIMNRELAEKFSNRTSKWLIMRFSKRINEYILEEGQDWQTATTAQLEQRLALQTKIINACELLPDGISEEEFCERVFKVKTKAIVLEVA